MSQSQTIMELRRITGAGMMDCKKALDESSGDFDKAIDILRSSGAIKAAKKSDRETFEGVVRFVANTEKTNAILLQVLCETDFVAKNSDFIASADQIAGEALMGNLEEVFSKHRDGLVLKIGENIRLGQHSILQATYVAGYIHGNNKVGSMIGFDKPLSDDLARDMALHIVALSPKYISRDKIDANDLAREKNVYEEQLRQEGKSAEMIAKILPGKLAKYYQEACLLEQSFIKDEDKKIKDLLGDVNVIDFKLFSI